MSEPFEKVNGGRRRLHIMWHRRCCDAHRDGYKPELGIESCRLTTYDISRDFALPK